MRFSAGARIENVSFAQSGDAECYGADLDRAGLELPAGGECSGPPAKGMVRNLTFQGIRATVVSEGGQYADMPFRNNFRPGETRSCITLERRWATSTWKASR